VCRRALLKAEAASRYVTVVVYPVLPTARIIPDDMQARYKAARDYGPVHQKLTVKIKDPVLAF
jgi:hypothetical protein